MPGWNDGCEGMIRNCEYFGVCLFLFLSILPMHRSSVQTNNACMVKARKVIAALRSRWGVGSVRLRSVLLRMVQLQTE